MDIGSILLILALFILVAFYISRPLMEKKEAILDLSESPEDHRRSILLSDRDRILNALKELDFDHALGKVPEADYPGQRARLVQKGTDVLRQLDDLDYADTEAVFEDEKQDHLEAAFEVHRADWESLGTDEQTHTEGSAESISSSGIPDPGIKAPVFPADDGLEVMLANRRRERKEKSAGFCPQCGGPIQKSDQFCPKCGHKLV